MKFAWPINSYLAFFFVLFSLLYDNILQLCLYGIELHFGYCTLDPYVVEGFERLNSEWWNIPEHGIGEYRVF